MKRRCAFFDRDGVINRKAPEGEYVNRWDDFHLIPQAVDWIRLFKAMGWLVVVVTNQRGVARGATDPDVLAEIHHRMTQALAARGATIDDVFVCTHEIGSCSCRKPQPGLVQAAQRKWDIDVARSIMIGDSDSDRQLAANCQMTFVAVHDGVIQEVIARAGSEAPEHASYEW